MSESKRNRIGDFLSNTIVNYRKIITLAFLCVLVVLGYFASYFKVNASADTLLTQNNEIYIKTQLANQKFSPAEFILVAYQPNDKAVFSQQAFDDLSELSKQFAAMDRVESINSMLSVPLIENKAQLVGSGNVTDLSYEKQNYSPETMKRLLANHPIYTDLLVNKQQDASAIQLVFKANPELEKLNRDILTIQKIRLEKALSDEQRAELKILKEQALVIEEEIGKIRQQEVLQIESIIQSVDANAAIYIGGSYVVGIRLVEIVKQDLWYFGLAITVLISALLLILFRTIRWLVFPLFACVSSVVITMGILALLKIPATVISANFVALQLILTLAIMLHLITCYREISRDKPEASQIDRVKETLNQKLAPCFYAAITTSIGFGSLIASGIQPIIDFGIMMLISNAVTLSIALVVFPSMLSFLALSKETQEIGLVTSFLNKLRKSIAARPKVFMLVPIILMSLTSIGIIRLDVENSFIDYFHKDTKVYQELSFIDKQFGGSTPLDIIINMDAANGSSDLFLRAEDVNKLHLGHAVIDAFEATGNVTSLINFTTLAKQLNDSKPLTEYELDVIYSMVDKALIDQLIGAYIDVDSNTMRISTRIQDTLPNLNRADLLKNIKADLAATGLSANDYELTSLFMLYQDILSRLFDSQIATLGIVYCALGLMLIAIFRSLKIALIALVPNVITTTTILGVIGWFGIPLDLMTITIAAIAMGIAIDDTIHFIDAYLTGEPGVKLRQSFAHTGLAITYTSSLIAIGFSMFVFSDFMPSVYFGVLTACAMVFALITDLTVLPAMLNIFVGDEQSNRVSEDN